MFPLRDDIPSQRYPIVTVTIIVLNVVAFFFELMLGQRLEQFLMSWSIVPARYTVPDVAGLFSWREQLLPFFTSISRGGIPMVRLDPFDQLEPEPGNNV